MELDHVARRSLLVVCALLACSCSRSGSGSTCADADLVVTNGHIITMDAARRVARAMAIRDGTIRAVSTDQEIRDCLSPRTQVIDLKGQTVLPGLIDVHTHALEWAKSIVRKEIDGRYPQVRSVADIVRLVRERTMTAARGDWVSGSAWDHTKMAERRYITRNDLDPVSPNNPVYLTHTSFHLAVANSAALALAGINRDTPDPPGGVIERDATGEPTGVLKERAQNLVADKRPPDPPDLAEQAARVVSEKALEVGLTTIHDSLLGGVASPGSSAEDMRAYQTAYQRGWLKLRVQMSPFVTSVADAEALLKSGLHTGFGDDYLKLGAVKIAADGGMGARAAAIYPPSVAGEPENLGILMWKPADMEKAHRILAGGGWQLATHAIGDRAIDEVLDSYAAAIKANDLRDARFRVVHAGVSTPAIQKRLQQLQVLVDGNPAFVYWIGDWFEVYGAERVRWAYPGKSYVDNGIIAGAGSDVSVTPISPWWGIYAAVVRRGLISGHVLAPEERLTVIEALQLFTRNGAYTGFEENKKGSLEPGKLADFIVIDRDVLTVSEEQLKDVQVLKTFVGSALLYEKSVAPK